MPIEELEDFGTPKLFYKVQTPRVCLEGSQVHPDPHEDYWEKVHHQGEDSLGHGHGSPLDEASVMKSTHDGIAWEAMHSKAGS